MWFLHINDNFDKESQRNKVANILYHMYIPGHMYIRMYMTYYVHVKKCHTEPPFATQAHLTHPLSHVLYGTATDLFNSGMGR
jgi:hypothetical protein